MLFVQALYFAATVINRNALINRDTSSTKQNVERGILAGGATCSRMDRRGAEQNGKEWGRPRAELIISTAARRISGSG